MAKRVNTSDRLNLSDLTQGDGFIFEVHEYQDIDEEEFPYLSTVSLTNEEELSLLNIDNIEDDDTNSNNNTEGNSVMLCNISFEKLKSKMTDILGNTKIMKFVKRKGIGPTMPSNGKVSIKYVGYFEYTDEPFDSSFTRGGTETFHLGQGMLIPGLEIAISSMQKHEIAIFIVHPDLAFGKYGCAPRIPPNSEILFVVHLIDYIDNESIGVFENLSIEERKIFANAVKGVQAKFNTAKYNFKMRKIKQAIKEYGKAIMWLEQAELMNQEEEDEMKKLLSKGYTNLAVCYNLENMPRRACSACNRVLIPSAKAYFNYGRALLKMGEYDKAMEKLQIARTLDPENKTTVKEMKLVNEKQRKYLELEKQLWKNCLGNEQNDKKEITTRKVLYKICENFAQDDQLLRQPFPEVLTPQEDAYIREQAAAFGLTVTTHQRYGREITYLNKFNY